MIIIAHRALTDGPDSVKENHPSQVKAALELGFDVELDVWYLDGKFALGHDKPQHEVPKEYFQNYKMWLHCKNVQALFQLRNHPCAEVFFHDQDDVVLTKGGYLWTFPKASIELTDKSIAVLPERVDEWELENVFGLCTDFPKEYKKDLKFKPLKPEEARTE